MLLVGIGHFLFHENSFWDLGSYWITQSRMKG